MTFLNDLLNIITTNTASDYITALVIILIFTVIGPMLSTCIIKLFRIKLSDEYIENIRKELPELSVMLFINH